MTRFDPDAVVVARETFFAPVDGVAQKFTEGVTRARASHPVVRARPGKFRVLEVQYDVERATKAPGERRQRTPAPAPAPPPQPNDALASLSFNELRDIAKERDIPVPVGTSKDDLLAKLG